MTSSIRLSYILNVLLILFIAQIPTSHSSAVVTNPPSTHPWLPSISHQANPSQEVSIAYFLQISDATLTLLPRLLRTIWHPHNIYIVHFDKKIPLWQRAHAQTSLFRADDKYKTNLYVMDSETITYRGISMVINTMNAMQFALDKSSQWTYFINISGSDYPLISPTNQRRLLASNDFVLNNRSFFSISEKDWWEESKVFRFDRLFTDTSLSFNQSSSEVVDSYVEQPIAQIANFTFAAAEAWMILHRQFVHHLLKSPFARRMLIAFSYSLEPEEHFFPSVALNSPAFNRTTVPHALRHVTWVHKGKHSGQHPYYVDERESDGKRWTFRKAIENSGCFFTRKIRIKDSALLNYIDTHVNGVAKNPVVKDVQKFLEKSRKLIDCVAKLNSVDPQRLCTGNGDVEE